jgi:hypothetical protein
MATASASEAPRERGHVGWGTGPGADVSDATELDALLDQADTEARTAGRRVLAVVALGQGRDLRIGLGADETLLGVDDHSGYQTWWSCGELYQDDQDVAFSLDGQPTYYPRWMLVPAALAREAAREVFRTGLLPTSVRWDQP